MVRARQTLRTRRVNDRILEELRGSIRQGIPWVIPLKPPRGYGDLIFLVRGAYYPICCDFIHDKEDVETLVAIWGELREEILTQHIKHRPGTRPWGWWILEDREPRRRLDRKACTCPPVAIHPKRPVHPSQLALSRSGRPYGCRCEYESELQYLKRLSLLIPEEKNALLARGGRM